MSFSTFWKVALVLSHASWTPRISTQNWVTTQRPRVPLHPLNGGRGQVVLKTLHEELRIQSHSNSHWNQWRVEDANLEEAILHSGDLVAFRTLSIKSEGPFSPFSLQLLPFRRTRRLTKKEFSLQTTGADIRTTHSMVLYGVMLRQLLCIYLEEHNLYFLPMCLVGEAYGGSCPA
jgi:hypothetical protein